MTEGNYDGYISEEGTENINRRVTVQGAVTSRVEAQGATAIEEEESVTAQGAATNEEAESLIKEVDGGDDISNEGEDPYISDQEKAVDKDDNIFDGENTEGSVMEMIESQPESEHESEYTDDDDSIEERRNKERDRRGKHLQIFSGSDFGRGKRKKKPNQAYSFLQTQFMEMKPEEKDSFFKHAWDEYKVTGKTNMIERYTTGMVFAQMSAQKGIKKYKTEAEQMLMAEFKQLLEYKTFHGVKATDLSYEQRSKAGNMINLIEEKINRGHTPENPVLKGRSCFNGKVQRGLYTKEQTASPTVSQDAFFLTCLIDALEGRSKAITDVKGAYLNAKMKDEVIMKIIGPEVDLFCQLDPSLREYVITEKGRKVLYTQLDKALYGCVQSALLWYELYSTTLKEMGFKINPYDLCVANANIKGKQCTICWYVDDNKISHEDPKVVEEVILVRCLKQLVTYMIFSECK